MTGEELRSLLVSKWGRSYDARLQTRNGRCAVCPRPTMLCVPYPYAVGLLQSLSSP